MRTNIEIDDALMEHAMRANGTVTKRETVADALRMLIRIREQAGIRRLRGKINWVGDLDEMRRD